MADLEVQYVQETDKMLGESDGDDDEMTSTRWERSKSRQWTRLHTILISLSAIVILETLLLVVGNFKGITSIAVPGGAVESVPANTTSACKEPAVRREWRYLLQDERKAFIDAVLCLYEVRSLFPGRGSLYDDIVFVHQYSGQAAHKHASFLPWHRLFIHEFERKLRDNCAFEGNLPYWDWTMDSQDLAGSSIWNNEEGFGNQEDGHECVSGPFKDVTLLHFNLTVRPHCLSRKFELTKSEDHGTFSGERMSPDMVGQLIQTYDYGTLRFAMEGIHDVIHNGVIGDLNTWSSANDPIFWLHHVQLDRIWWMWQQVDPEHRLMDFGHSLAQVSFSTIDEEMEYLGLFENRTIAEVMRTDTDILCYRY